MAVGSHCSCILVVISNVALIGVLKVLTPCHFVPREPCELHFVVVNTRWDFLAQRRNIRTNWSLIGYLKSTLKSLEVLRKLNKLNQARY